MIRYFFTGPDSYVRLPGAIGRLDTLSVSPGDTVWEIMEFIQQVYRHSLSLEQEFVVMSEK